jgi:addiction module RelE/StbE family toxin
LRVRWTGPARRDLSGIEAYIAQDDIVAAAQVALRIAHHVNDTLPTQPYIGRPGRVMEIRELVIPRLPYIVAYRIRGEVIEVVRVLHTSRMWPERF